MPLPRLLAPLALATGFGVVNAVLVHLHAHPVAEFGSHVLNAGWAWAGLAVAAGALLGSPRLGAVAGGLAAGTALAAYYVTDAALRDVSLATSAAGDAIWGAATVLVCPLLGFVGTRLRRPGTPGLLAGLVVPVGAAVEMLLLPPGPPSPAVTWTRWVVGVLAVAGVVLAARTHVVHGEVRPPAAPAASARSPHRPPPRRRR